VFSWGFQAVPLRLDPLHQGRREKLIVEYIPSQAAVSDLEPAERVRGDVSMSVLSKLAGFSPFVCLSAHLLLSQTPCQRPCRQSCSNTSKE
jgi:hypothetical protein